MSDEYDTNDIRFLLSPDGAALLSSAASSGLSDFALATFLRQRTTPARAALVSLTLQLRQKAAAKFSRADAMFFTRSALEQASAESVSRHRARRFAARACRHVLDLCCGIGGDALALAESAAVTGVDLDPTRLLMAQANLQAYGLTNFTPLQADVLHLSPAEFAHAGVDAIFIDPARRDANGRRIFNPEQYSPPLSELLRWQKIIPNCCAKIGPGADITTLPPTCEIEFISVNGELREGVLWFGGLRTGARTSATLLPQGITISGENPHVGCGDISAYLYEPDPALLRAGLVELCAAQIGAHKIDARISYLSSADLTPTPLATAYEILEHFPYDEKRLKKRLKEMQAGHLELKKRGLPVDPAALHKKLRPAGKNSATVFLTRHLDCPTIIITRRTSAARLTATAQL